MPMDMALPDLDCQRALLETLEASPDCVKILDLEGRVVSINDNGRRFVGAPREAILGRRWTDFVPVAFRQAAAEGHARACAGQTVRLAAPCETHDGLRHCDLTLSPLRDRAGRVGWLLAVTRDVTELVQARLLAEQRERDQRRQSAALKAAGVVARLGAWEIDFEAGRVFWSDELWGLMRGLPRPLFVEAPFPLLDAGDAPAVSQTLESARAGGEPFRFDVQLRREDGSAMWARVFGAAEGGSGRAGMLRGGVQDVTDEREAEQRLVAALQAAQSATAAKSAFLANMSHEIRTPLNGILGMAQVLERDVLAPEQRERLRVIRKSGEALMSVLNDVLDISKIEAGRLTLELRAFSLAPTLEAACGPFRYMAEQKDLDFEIAVDEAARGQWRGDDLRIRQIITNLVSNALKFTFAGAITVRARRVGEALRIEVEDTGVGIGQPTLEALFEKFSQADSSTSRRYGGTGLGLAICRDLVTLMGGDIVVDSQLGRGTRFEVNLPLEKLAGEPESDARGETRLPLAADAPIRILAAEDNMTNQQILQAMLDPLGADLVLVANGDEAVSAFQAGAFHLVLMDIQMPGRNGVDATRAIRQFERDTARVPTPILALSANVMAHQVAEYRAAGMDGLIEKPIEIGVLYGAIEAALDAGSA